MDEAAEREFAEYFRARRDAVRRTAFLLCGDWHRADDHAQAAFVALHRNWRKIRDRAALDAWMRRTVVRAVVDESRRPWRRERATAEHVVAHLGRGHRAAHLLGRLGHRVRAQVDRPGRRSGAPHAG